MAITHSRMHIGFDISQTGSGKAGCGYFAHAIAEALLKLAPEHRYSLFPSFGDFCFDARMPLRNPYRKGHYGPRHLTREMAREFWTNDKVELSLGNPDIVHSNNFWCPTQLQSSRLIYTFYDMGFVVEPKWAKETNRVGCFEGVFRASIAADWIVAISKASQAHYERIFPHFPKDRIRVIYPCSRFLTATREGACPKVIQSLSGRKFWLNVGTVEPRKNQRHLVEAYARYLALGGAPIPLVLAGGSGWLMDDFKAYLRQLNIEEHIIFTGYVSDDELIWLYRNCYANLYPSWFEGFGLPVLEGMQFGAPTLVSNTTSLPEVAGDAAILLSPKDPEAWAQAMLLLSVNLEEKERLSRVAREQAQHFQWEKSAAALLDLYAEAYTSPKVRHS